MGLIKKIKHKKKILNALAELEKVPQTRLRSIALEIFGRYGGQLLEDKNILLLYEFMLLEKKLNNLHKTLLVKPFI